VLKSEQANYLATKDQIELPGRTTVVGDGMELEGSRMEVEMEGKKLRLIRNVKTRLEPEKLAKKKTKANASAQIGG
jgi:lipopolysaccharide export system protein LptA